MSPRFVAFLRGINVGGHTAQMGTLRELFTTAGLTGVETFIASGNVVFGSRARDLAAVERKLERRLHAALGFEVRTFVRSAAEVAAIAADQPFPAARLASAAGTYIGFLATPPTAKATTAVLTLRSPNDDLHVRGREIYWLSQGGMSGSRLSYVALERALDGQATFRSLNTITRLVATYGLAE